MSGGAPLSVLVLCEYPTLNGGEYSLLAALPHVQAGGVCCRVAAPSAGPLAETLDELGIERLDWDLPAGAERLEAGRQRLAELLDRPRPELPSRPAWDLVHANSLAMARLAGPVCAARGLPSVGHLRDILKLSRQAIRDLNANRRLVAVSHAVAAWHHRQGLDSDRLVVVHNGVDGQRFRPRRPTGWIRSKLALGQRSRLLGAIGQIGPRKGLDLLLDAMLQVVQQGHDCHLVHAGTRTSGKDEAVRYEAELQARSLAPELRGRVHWLGRVPAELLLPELDMLVHPARQEPLGRVLLEAAACGLPIVATEVGGTAEIFPDDSRAAILVPPEDSGALGHAVRRLLDSPEAARELGQAARRRVSAAFSAFAAGQQLLRVYREVYHEV